VRILPEFTLLELWRHGLGVKVFTGNITRPRTGGIYESAMQIHRHLQLSIRGEYTAFRPPEMGGIMEDRALPGEALFITSRIVATW
jgi:hypothetical protein